MKKVYAVGVMQLDISPTAKYPIISDRLWHLYLNFEDAEQAVLENRGDMFEYYYNYALIEETLVIDPHNRLPQEEHSDYFPPKEWWYQAVYNREPSNEPASDPIITKVDKPSCLEKTVYFWVG